MKKVMKKLGMTITALCMMLMIPVITSYAAEGTLQFSDPTGKVGEEITVKVKMEGGGQPIGDGTATLAYDAAKLEFVSGTNATAENGTITIAASGTGAETELNFELVFKALAEGETAISVTGSTAYLFSDETLNLQPGTSTIKVEAGDGTTSTASESEERKVGEENIEVAGTMYGIYENFTDALIPEGFSKTTITYNGEEHNAIKQDASGKTIVYLIAGSNDPVMALYKEDGSFVVTELVSQADDYYLLVLGETDGSALPEQFQPTTIEINGTQFPAWQNMESPDYFLMYALSSAGTEGYYQYDSVEETYQRYTVEEVEPKEEEKPGNPIIEKAKALVNEYFLIVLVAGAALFLLMLIILIVLSVKLRSRNADLDAFYDEYEDDDVPETEYDEEYDDEYEEEYDEEYDDEYDDEYDEEYDDDEYDDEEYDDDEEYEDDDEDDDRKKRGFDIEFIDL